MDVRHTLLYASADSGVQGLTPILYRLTAAYGCLFLPQLYWEFIIYSNENGQNKACNNSIKTNHTINGFSNKKNYNEELQLKTN